MKYEYAHQAYVADDGNYGVASVLTFDFELFIDRYPKAWEVLDNVSDYYRTEFMLAVLDQDEDTLKDFANDYEFDLADVLDQD